MRVRPTGRKSCTHREFFRTPGYPIFLASTPSLRAALSAQAVTGAATCFVVSLLVLNVWGLSAAIAAELLLALDIP